MSLSLAQATTDKVIVTNPLTFGAGAAFSYVQWVKQRAAPGGSQGTGKGGFDFFVFSGGSGLWFAEIGRAGGAAIGTYTNSDLFPDTDWSYIVVTYSEGNGVRMYRGSFTIAPAILTQSSGSTNGSGNTNSDTGDLWIGNRGSGTSLSPAHDIALVELWPIELTAAQIVARWGGSLLTTAPSMRLLLGDNGTGTQPDLSGNGKSGTVTGTTQIANPPWPRRWGRRVVVSPYEFTAPPVGGTSQYYYSRRRLWEAA